MAEDAAPPAELSVMDALKAVLLKARVHDGLKRGLHECAKVLDRRVARLCVLASNCSVEEYKKLVKALCDTNGIPIIEVETHQLLGEWCGLCKLDKEGKARKVITASLLWLFACKLAYYGRMLSSLPS
jgi:small subunit ribosomal protein S12e